MGIENILFFDRNTLLGCSRNHVK